CLRRSNRIILDVASRARRQRDNHVIEGFIERHIKRGALVLFADHTRAASEIDSKGGGIIEPQGLQRAPMSNEPALLSKGSDLGGEKTVSNRRIMRGKDGDD